MHRWQTSCGPTLHQQRAHCGFSALLLPLSYHCPFPAISKQAGICCRPVPEFVLLIRGFWERQCRNLTFLNPPLPHSFNTLHSPALHCMFSQMSSLERTAQLSPNRKALIPMYRFWLGCCYFRTCRAIIERLKTEPSCHCTVRL